MTSAKRFCSFDVRMRWLLIIVGSLLAVAGTPSDALSHAVAAGDKGFLQEVSGVLLIPFVYLGAKHMVTGYDHLLFLFGVIFFSVSPQRHRPLRHAFCSRPLDDASDRCADRRERQLVSH